jgi:hypothetical protein
MNGLSEEQILELLELSKSLRADKSRKDRQQSQLPQDIFEDLERVTKQELERNINSKC